MPKELSHQLAQFIKLTGNNICPFVAIDVLWKNAIPPLK